LQKSELPWPSIAVPKKRIFAVPGETLFADVAQEMRPGLSRCLNNLVDLNNKWIGILARTPDEFVGGSWDEMANPKVRLI
jgi:hypothetical protein